MIVVFAPMHAKYQEIFVWLKLQLRYQKRAGVVSDLGAQQQLHGDILKQHPVMCLMKRVWVIAIFLAD